MEKNPVTDDEAHEALRFLRIIPSSDAIVFGMTLAFHQLRHEHETEKDIDEDEMLLFVSHLEKMVRDLNCLSLMAQGKLVPKVTPEGLFWQITDRGVKAQKRLEQASSDAMKHTSAECGT